MEPILAVNVLELFTNLKGFLDQAIKEYHSWVYLILFAIIFCETGLVVTPFLPGDSLLFMAGTFTVAAANGQTPLEIKILLPVLFMAPMLGDSTNYWIGRFIGPKIFHKENVRFLNKKHLEEAHRFYEKHGGKVVVIARFVPIFRTFIPFVAGIGKMYYPRFLAFSVGGTLAWISLCVFSGRYFGTMPFIQKHFELTIIAIIAISMIPPAVGFIKVRMAAKKAAAESDKN